jgi:anti-sigma factor RsiW
MTADEFRTALRILHEGRPSHTIYEVEDAVAMIAPVRRALWRMFAAVILVAIIPLSAMFSLMHAPTAASTVVMMLPIGLLSLRAFRDWAMPVRGLNSDEIIRAAMK